MAGDQFAEQFRSGGALPSGPVSPWPKGRRIQKADKIKATGKEMFKSAIQNAGRAMKGGSVTPEVRNERFDTCRACPSFIKNSGRCKECGCFMKVKTWINANPDELCPLKKWDR